MVWLAENIQACLRDFLAATASMARKRHLASSARGFYCFCLAPSIRKQIRPIRGRTEIKRTGAPLTRRRISLWLQGSLFCTANGSYFVLWLSVCQRADQTGGEVQSGKLACMDEHHYLTERA